MVDQLRLKVVLALQERVLAPFKRIQDGSGNTAKALKAASDTLKELNKAQSDVTGYSRTRRALRQQSAQLLGAQAKSSQYATTLQEQRTRHVALTANLRTAKHAYNQITTAYQDGKIQGAEYTRQIELARITLLSSEQAHARSLASVNKYKAQVKNAGERVAGLTKTIQGGTERLASYKTRLDAAGVDTSRLSAHSRTLKGSIEAATTSIDRQKEALRALGVQQAHLAKLNEKHSKDMARLGMRGAMAAGVGMAGQRMGRGMMPAVDAFMEAESQETQFKISLMQADGSVAPEFQKIVGLAQKLGDRLPGTTADFIEMMTTLRKEGMSTQTILGGLGESSALLGVLLDKAPAQAAALGAKMQDALGASESEMMGILDMMQRSHYAGADADYMLAGFGNLAPVLSIIKQKGLEAMQTLSPMMVMMNQAGMTDGSSAGNAIRKVYQHTMNAKKLAKANAAVKAAGGGFKLDFSDGKGEFGGQEKLFSQLQKLQGLNTMQRGAVMKELFGDDAETLRVLDKFIEKGLPGYQEIVQKLKDQADLNQRVNAQLDTLANTAEAAQGSFTNMLKELGASIAPELKDLLERLGEMAAALGQWVRENPRVAKALMLLAAGIAALMVVVGGLGVALVGVLGPLAIVRFMTARWALGLLAARTGAAGAAGGVSLLGRASGGLATAWKALRTLGVSGMFKTMATAMASPGAWLGVLKGGFMGVWRLLTAFARANPIAALVLGLGGLFMGLYVHWDKIKEYFNAKEWWSMAKEIWAAVEWGLNAATAGIYGLLKTIAMKAISGAWEGIKSFVGMQEGSDKTASTMRAAAAASAIAVSPMAHALHSGQVNLQRPVQPIAQPVQIAAKAAAPSTSNTTNQITIHAAPGMDDKAVARAVTTELERRERRSQFTRRSRLQDLD